MFVRVYDKKNSTYYKSIVYSTVGIVWLLQFIVLNPNTNAFELVDYLDKSVMPAKPIVEIIQSDDSGFMYYHGAALLKYKHFCKVNKVNSADIGQMIGYPDASDNYTILAAILAE